MSGSTTELGLKTCVDADDNADYLTIDLANSLRTLDAVMNNVTGHNHAGAHQGGPLVISTAQIADGAITTTKLADGSVTTPKLADASVNSAKIVDGSIQTIDLADGSVTTPKIAASVTLTSPTLNSAQIPSPNITNPTISGTISGNPSFNAGPHTTDWWRSGTNGTGIINEAVGQGIAFDGSGSFLYPSGDRIVGATAVQTLSNKTINSPLINSPSIGQPMSFDTNLGNKIVLYPSSFGLGVQSNRLVLYTGAEVDFSSGDSSAAPFFLVNSAGDVYLRGSGSNPGALISNNPSHGQPANTIYMEAHARVFFDLSVGHTVTCQNLVQTSDPRAKSSMAVMADDVCMTRVRNPAMSVYSFQLPPPSGGESPPDNPVPTPTDIGFDATQVYAASPEFAALDGQGAAIAVNYPNMAALLWGALRALDARCTAKGI